MFRFPCLESGIGLVLGYLRPLGDGWMAESRVDCLGGGVPLCSYACLGGDSRGPWGSRKDSHGFIEKIREGFDVVEARLHGVRQRGQPRVDAGGLVEALARVPQGGQGARRALRGGFPPISGLARGAAGDDRPRPFAGLR